MKKYDIVVVGGGPAGSSFLYRLGQKNKNYKAIMIDDKNKNKVCGGLLNEKTQKFLSKMNINIPKEILVTPQMFSVKIHDLNLMANKNLPKTYINLDRDKFDKYLQSLLNYPIIDGHVLSIKKHKDIYIIKYKSENGIERIACKYLIGADGGKSIVRKSSKIELDTREYTSIQKWYKSENINCSPYMSAVFDSENSDCCSWTISKDDYFIFGGAFRKKDAISTFEKQRKKFEKWNIKLEDEVKTEACTVLRPKNLKSFSTGRENVYLIGEASGLISPSSLEGISFALRSGYYLAENFGKKNMRSKVNIAMLPLQLESLSKNIKGVGMYTEWIRQGFIRM